MLFNFLITHIYEIVFNKYIFFKIIYILYVFENFSISVKFSPFPLLSYSHTVYLLRFLDVLCFLLPGVLIYGIATYLHCNVSEDLFSFYVDYMCILIYSMVYYYYYYFRLPCHSLQTQWLLIEVNDQS